MTVVLHDAQTIRLIGACPAEDGETLLQQLLANPMAQVDWHGCESAHGAVVQVLVRRHGRRQERVPVERAPRKRIGFTPPESKWGVVRTVAEGHDHRSEP